MRQGIDQSSAEPICLARRLDARLSRNGNGARHGDGYLSSYCSSDFERKGIWPPRQCAHGLQPQHQRCGLESGKRRDGRIKPLSHRPHMRMHAVRDRTGGGIEPVIIADVKDHPFESEDAVDGAGQVAQEPIGVLKKHHLLA